MPDQPDDDLRDCVPAYRCDVCGEIGCDGEACEDDTDPDDDVIRCWCGAEGTAEELFDESVYSQTCGGSGTLTCECGGEFCVCHHHGDVECPGCVDCLGGEGEGCDDDGYDLGGSD